MPRGGKRQGAGCPRSDKPRCYCGQMTANRAKRVGHHCQPQNTSTDSNSRERIYVPIDSI